MKGNKHKHAYREDKFARRWWKNGRSRLTQVRFDKKRGKKVWREMLKRDLKQQEVENA